MKKNDQGKVEKLIGKLRNISRAGTRRGLEVGGNTKEGNPSPKYDHAKLIKLKIKILPRKGNRRSAEA